MTDDEIIRVLEDSGVRFQKLKAPRGEVHLTIGAVQASTLVAAVRAVLVAGDSRASLVMMIGGRRWPTPTLDDPLGQREV